MGLVGMGLYVHVVKFRYQYPAYYHSLQPCVLLNDKFCLNHTSISYFRTSLKEMKIGLQDSQHVFPEVIQVIMCYLFYYKYY